MLENAHISIVFLGFLEIYRTKTENIALKPDVKIILGLFGIAELKSC